MRGKESQHCGLLIQGYTENRILQMRLRWRRHRVRRKPYSYAMDPLKLPLSTWILKFRVQRKRVIAKPLNGRGEYSGDSK